MSAFIVYLSGTVICNLNTPLAYGEVSLPTISAKYINSKCTSLGPEKKLVYITAVIIHSGSTFMLRFSNSSLAIITAMGSDIIRNCMRLMVTMVMPVRAYLVNYTCEYTSV